ncbi:MAG: UDP-N-acetylmuramate dehydrogenase [Pseudomonadota bacterium]
MSRTASSEPSVEAGFDVPLKNSLALPARAYAALHVSEASGIARALELAVANAVPLLPLGAGSNVVLPAAVDAVVLQASDRDVRVLQTTDDTVHLRVGAAHDWHALVCWTLAQGYFGLENLALIPGNVGAAPVQNIGAYGRELDEFVEFVDGFHLDDGRRQSLTHAECAFSYRSSVFKEVLRDRFVITSVDFRLYRQPRPVTHYPALAERLSSGVYEAGPGGIYTAVIDLRRERLPDPERSPNVGSFFKNPIVGGGVADRLRSAYPLLPVHPQPDGQAKLSAAWLIDSCDLRGYRLGPAGVSTRHALVLENLGGAGQADVLALAAHIRDRIEDRYGVRLEVEPRVYNASGRIEAHW